MSRLVILLGLITTLTGAVLFDPGVRLSSIRVEKQNNDVVLTWESAAEEGVSRYEILRKSPSSGGAFLNLGVQIPAQGSGSLYQFRDTRVYKTASEEIQYQLQAVFVNGDRYGFEIESIDYSATAVRRTWGSIKAMFQ